MNPINKKETIMQNERIRSLIVHFEIVQKCNTTVQ